MSDLKILNACWLVEMYDYLKRQKELILNRFGKTMKYFHELFTRIEKKEEKNHRKISVLEIEIFRYMSL